MSEPLESRQDRALRRYITIVALASFVGFGLWFVIDSFFAQAPGSYEVRRGDQMLSDGKIQEALGYFQTALEKSPNHLGAIMGMGTALLQSSDPAAGEVWYRKAIAMVEARRATPQAQDGKILAAAYGNLGILFDRQGDYQRAFDHYLRALKADSAFVEGPQWVDKLLYNMDKPSTIRDRAAYIYQQLALPEDQRLLRKPELDNRQRMYKP